MKVHRNASNSQNFITGPKPGYLWLHVMVNKTLKEKRHQVTEGEMLNKQLYISFFILNTSFISDLLEHSYLQLSTIFLQGQLEKGKMKHQEVVLGFGSKHCCYTVANSLFGCYTLFMLEWPALFLLRPVTSSLQPCNLEITC